MSLLIKIFQRAMSLEVGQQSLPVTVSEMNGGLKNMKRMSEIANMGVLQAQQHKKQRSSIASKTCDDVLLKRMFITFSVFYGPSWDKNLATDELSMITRAVWVKALSGLKREQIEHGLDNLHGTFAINPSEFRQLCSGDDGLHKSGAYRMARKILPAPRDLALARGAKENIRAILAGGSHG